MKVAKKYDNIKFHGRIIWDNETQNPIFYWTASGFEFNMTGDSFNLLLSSDYGNETEKVYISVYENDELIKEIELRRESMLYSIEFSHKCEMHNVKVLKSTEGQSNSFALENLDLGDGLFVEVPKQTQIKMEFLGDSITCGWGAKSTMNGDLVNEDGLNTYACVAARELQCDFNIIAASGWGLVKSAEGNEKRTIPYIYDKIAGIDNAREYKCMEWDFGKYIPDIVVVNLGTNDANPQANVTGQQFKDKMISFIEKIKCVYPDSYIIWCTGIMGNMFAEEVNETFAFLPEKYKEKIFYLEFEHLTENGHKGFMWHPSTSANRIHGHILAEFIRKNIYPIFGK